VATATHVLTVVAGCEGVHNASFSWTPTTPTVGQVVTFTASASGTEPIAYDWYFGDGAAGSGVSVTHSYTLAAQYPVALTATNACGTANDERILRVEAAKWRIYLPIVVRGG
jgi:PKD repeat protein